MERVKGDAKLMDPRQNLARANKQLKALSQADRRFVGSHAYQLRKSTVTENGDRYGTIYVDSRFSSRARWLVALAPSCGLLVLQRRVRHAELRCKDE